MAKIIGALECTEVAVAVHPNSVGRSFAHRSDSDSRADAVESRAASRSDRASFSLQFQARLDLQKGDPH